MTVETILPIVVSLISLIIATLALGWNIYRDIVLKPKLRVSISVSSIQSLGAKPKTSIVLSATNFGPGEITCMMVYFKNAPLWRRILRKTEQGVIIHDDPTSIAGRLPTKLDIGDRLDLLFPYDETCFLGHEITHIGIRDTYGRDHWANRKEVKGARKRYLRDYGDESIEVASSDDT